MTEAVTQITPGTGVAVAGYDVTTLNGSAVSERRLQRVSVTFNTGAGAARDPDLGTGNVGSATQRVVLASNQPPVPVTGTFWPTTQPVSQSGTWNIANITGTISLPTGAATASNQATIIGHVDGIETQLTTLAGHVDGIETALTAANASLDAIEAASSALVATTTISNIPVGTDSSEILAASASRKPGTFIVNNGDVDVWLNNGAAAVGTGHRLRPGGSYEVNHQQIVRGIVASGTANVSVESY